MACVHMHIYVHADSSCACAINVVGYYWRADRHYKAEVLHVFLEEAIKWEGASDRGNNYGIWAVK